MLRPSYTDLLTEINKDVTDEGEMIGSRYTIVIAAAKRARQLINNEPALIPCSKIDKPVSIAVSELFQSKIHIIQSDEHKEHTEENFTMGGNE